MAEKASKPTSSKTWIIGIIFIVLILGGAGLYQMKQKNKLQAQLDEKDKKSTSSTNGQSLGGLGGDDKKDQDGGNGQSLGS